MKCSLLLLFLYAGDPAGDLAKQSRGLFERLIDLKLENELLIVRSGVSQDESRAIIRSARYSFSGISRFSYRYSGGSGSTSSGGSGGSVTLHFEPSGQQGSYEFQLTSADNAESITLRQESPGQLNVEFQSRKYSFRFQQTKGRCTFKLKAGADSISARGRTFAKLMQQYPERVRNYLFAALERYFDRAPVGDLAGAPPGKTLFELKDGSRVVGTLELAALRLHTDYGTLTVPKAEIRHILFPESEGGRTETNAAKNGKILHEGCRILALRFSPVGTLEAETFEVVTPYGMVSIKPRDVRRVAFGPPVSP